MLDSDGFDDQQVVYEQFTSYIDYLSGENKLNMFDNMPYFLNGNLIIIHASELKNNFEKIIELIKQTKQNIAIKFLSSKQSALHDSTLTKLGFERSARSENEVIYNVLELSTMAGPRYAKIRNKRNVISRIGFYYQPITEENCLDAIEVNRQWRKSRGETYGIDRSKNEEKMISSIVNNTSSGIVQYLDNKPTGYCIYDTSRPVFIQFITKGLNNNDGNRYASTALYLKVFEIAKELGFEYINDGDLGKEPGTIAHKKAFNPSILLKTYDYYLKRSVL